MEPRCSGRSQAHSTRYGTFGMGGAGALREPASGSASSVSNRTEPSCRSGIQSPAWCNRILDDARGYHAAAARDELRIGVTVRRVIRTAWVALVLLASAMTA